MSNGIYIALESVRRRLRGALGHLRQLRRPLGLAEIPRTRFEGQDSGLSAAFFSVSRGFIAVFKVRKGELIGFEPRNGAPEVFSDDADDEGIFADVGRHATDCDFWANFHRRALVV